MFTYIQLIESPLDKSLRFANIGQLTNFDAEHCDRCQAVVFVVDSAHANSASSENYFQMILTMA